MKKRNKLNPEKKALEEDIKWLAASLEHAQEGTEQVRKDLAILA